MTADRPTTVQKRRDRRVAAICVSVVVAMVGMAYAAVPLYRLFCQVTGFAGTTQRAITPSTVVLDKPITVRFDANVAPGLAWRFEPVEHTMTVKVGENALAFYRVTNVSDRPMTGSASFNVYPDVMGAYFNKMQCFCFTEQLLQPGESIDMPVSFFVDAAMADDKDASGVRYMTLSYTFHKVDAPKQSAAVPAKGPNGT